MTALDPDVAALELAAAEAAQGAVPLFTDRQPDLSWSQARAIALARDRLRLEGGEQLVGYKLGWTSAAMREALGIERPNWGTLWASMNVGRSPANVDRSRHRHPKVEPELVYLAPSAISGDVTAAEVMATGGTWALGLEIVDPNFPTFDFRWLDNTADNSSASAFAVSDFRRVGAEIDEVEVVFDDGSDHRSGRATQAMGSPWEAVAWLVRSLAAEGRRLEEGHIVFTGGLTAPFDLTAGARFVLTSPHWSDVVLDVT